MPHLKKKKDLYHQTFNFHLSVVNYREREKKEAEKGFFFP